MAVLAISISEKGRNLLGMILLILNLSIVIINIVTIFIGIAIAVFFNQQRNVLHEFNYSRLDSLIIFSGLALAVFHSFGAKMSFDCGNMNTRERLKKFLMPFLGLLFVAIALLITMSISTSAAIYQLSKGYEKGFRDLMETYDADKDKRMEIDLLQIRNKCCGSTGYKYLCKFIINFGYFIIIAKSKDK